MDVDILGSRRLLPDGFEARASAKVAKLGRQAPVLERAELRFTEGEVGPVGTRVACEATLTGHGHCLRCRVDSRDAMSAVDLVVAKLEHQVERLKGRLVERSQPRRPQKGVRGSRNGAAPLGEVGDLAFDLD